MAEKFVKDKIASDKVVVFSKSYCPFCSMAKKSLTDVGLKNFTVIEIEDRGEIYIRPPFVRFAIMCDNLRELVVNLIFSKSLGSVLVTV